MEGPPTPPPPSDQLTLLLLSSHSSFITTIFTLQLEKTRPNSGFEWKIRQRLSFCIEFFPSCQISNYMFYNVSDFEVNVLQRVRFWSECFSFCQILKSNFCEKPNFEEKIFFPTESDFEERLTSKTSCFPSICSVKTTNFSLFVLI